MAREVRVKNHERKKGLGMIGMDWEEKGMRER